MLKRYSLPASAATQNPQCVRSRLRSRSRLLAALILSSAWLGALPVLAVSPTPGTVIDNQATGSFIDSTDNSEKAIASNTVSVTVGEVAGITVTAANTPSAAPGGTANFEFRVTNVGNDPTQFFIPGAPSASTGGTAGTLKIIAYDPDGTGPLPAVDLTASNLTVPPGGATTGTVLGAIAAANNGVMPVEGAIVVQVPVTVTATNGTPVSVTLGNTGGQPSASNTPYVVGANGTGGQDVYTVDNVDGVAGEATGLPLNGDATNRRQEASASNTVTAIAVNVTVSGLVFSDADGNVTINGTDAGTNAGSANLTVYAVNSSGNVVDKATVNANGIYSLTNVPVNSTLTLRLSNNATVAIGATAPALPTLPATWVNTGESLNGTIDTATLGNITLTTTTTNLTNYNFGIQQIPSFGLCPAPVYMTQGNNLNEITLSSVNLITGALTVINPAPVAGGVNAIGLNLKDGYIYGIRDSDRHIARVDANAKSHDLGLISGLPSTLNYHTGDVDTNGILHVKPNGTGNNVIYAIDVNPQSPTYLTLVKTITFSQDLSSIRDIAFHPTNGKLYTITIDSKLWEVSWPSGAAPTATATVVDRGIPTNLPKLNASWGALYFDITGALYAYNNSGKIYRITNVNAGVPQAIVLTTTAPTRTLNDGARCPLAPPIVLPTVSGTVFHDPDGSKLQNGTEVGTNAGGLTAVLVNAANTQVMATATVAADGSYSFTDVPPNAAYTVQITTAIATVGAAPPAISLPTGWGSTGENLNGIVDGTVNSTVSVSVGSSSITGVNLGIERLPDTADVASTNQTNPGGTTPLQVPTLAGTDPEDGTLGSGKTFKIVTLPTNGTLTYNGTAVTAGQTIASYNPALLQLDPNDGAITVNFTYAAVDVAGQVDPTPATVTMPFTTVAKVLLVKRITAINGDRTQNPNDNTPLNLFVDDTTSSKAAEDNDSKWVTNYLKGAINAGKVKPGDTIEYTIYFLNVGNANANRVRICDRLRANQTFQPNGYGSGTGMQLQMGTSPVINLTNADDGSDRTQFIAAGGSIPANCNITAANTDGTIVVDITGAVSTGNPMLVTMPGATAAGSPNDSYGFFRFITQVNF